MKINDLPRELINIIVNEKQDFLGRFVIKSVSKRFNNIVYKMFTVLTHKQAFKLAIIRKHINLCNWLKDTKSDYTEMVQDFILYNQLDCLKLFKELGFILYTSAYYDAIRYGHFEMVKWMIRNNNFESKGAYLRRELLQFAHGYGKKEIEIWLINNLHQYITC